MTTHRARRLWERYEPIHAVTYFSPVSMTAAATAGLKGFWMGYFGFRAAPMGAVSAATVEATFANFAPARVRRAVPDAWSFAAPAVLLDARRTSAAAALRELDDDVEATATAANPMLERIVEAGEGLGRVLFAANKALPLPEDPVERLWQLCTCLREHRGDGHVMALAGEEVTGPQAHLLRIAEGGFAEDKILLARGFDQDEWNTAKDSLRARGLLENGMLTEVGAALRVRIEQRTDQLADPPLRALSSGELEALLAALDPTARAIGGSGMIPDENPLGLPVLD
ncbi:MAG: hypothetical protein HKN24_13055 [Acidimicrobiales bacterium]|nr:hypothetical protein [Acidimicrobiales bacterium]